MIKKLLIGIVIVLVGWALAVFIPWRKSTPTASAEERPGEVMKRYYAAHNSGDSVALLKTASKSMIEHHNASEPEFAKRLAWFKLHPAEVTIISDSSVGDIGYVTYRYHRADSARTIDTVVQSQVFKEDGQWKVGGW